MTKKQQGFGNVVSEDSSQGEWSCCLTSAGGRRELCEGLYIRERMKKRNKLFPALCVEGKEEWASKEAKETHLRRYGKRIQRQFERGLWTRELKEGGIIVCAS